MWYNEMTIMLRHYIDDLGAVPVYSDSRLQECLIVAAIQVHNEVDIKYNGSTYQISLETLDISPDPTEGDSRNENFMLLSAYKAATIISASEFKTASGKNILVRDGGSEVDMRNLAAQKKDAANFYKRGYEDLRTRYAYNNCQLYAVISPPAIYGNWGGSNYGGGYYGNYSGFRDQPYFA